MVRPLCINPRPGENVCGRDVYCVSAAFQRIYLRLENADVWSRSFLLCHLCLIRSGVRSALRCVTRQFIQTHAKIQ